MSELSEHIIYIIEIIYHFNARWLKQKRLLTQSPLPKFNSSNSDSQLLMRSCAQISPYIFDTIYIPFRIVLCADPRVELVTLSLCKNRIYGSLYDVSYSLHKIHLWRQFIQTYIFTWRGEVALSNSIVFPSLSSGSMKPNTQHIPGQ